MQLHKLQEEAAQRALLATAAPGGALGSITDSRGSEEQLHLQILLLGSERETSNRGGEGGVGSAGFLCL